MKPRKNLSFLSRLSFAFDGISYALKNEKSFRTHSLVTLALLVTSLIIRPSLIWAGLLCVCVALVTALELFNSAIESLCDLITNEPTQEVKVAKDCAAAGVLIASATSVFVFILFIFSISF